MNKLFLAIALGSVLIAGLVAQVSSATGTVGGESAAAPEFTTYRNDAIGLALLYPTALKPDDAKSLRDAIERGHRAYYKTDPETNPEHQKAEKCLHVLLSASIPETAAQKIKIRDTNHSPPIETEVLAEGSILLVELDRSCLPPGAKYDEILGSIAATPKNLPGFKVTNPQMWYEVDKHKIHLGSAANYGSESKYNTDSEPQAVFAASFAEKKHMLAVMLVTNNPVTSRLLMQSMIRFGKHEPTPLMPFAFGDGMPINLVR
jgi:hypothetical protein